MTVDFANQNGSHQNCKISAKKAYHLSSISPVCHLSFTVGDRGSYICFQKSMGFSHEPQAGPGLHHIANEGKVSTMLWSLQQGVYFIFINKTNYAQGTVKNMNHLSSQSHGKERVSSWIPFTESSHESLFVIFW